MHRIRLSVIALCAALLLVAAGAQGASSDVVISQVYAGGGNAGASYTNDYVELLNRGSSTVDLSGWTVQYATAAGTSWQTTALTGTVQPGRVYLVRHRRASGGDRFRRRVGRPRGRVCRLDRTRPSEPQLRHRRRR